MKHLLNIFTYVRSLWRYYVGVIVLGTVSTGLALATPFVMKAITDVIVHAQTQPSGGITLIVWLSVLLFVVDVLAGLIANWSGYLGDIMSARLREILSNRYYEHLLLLPQQYYDNELTGKIINRLNRTITEVTNFINMFVNNFFSMYLTLIVSIVILAFYSWFMAAMMILLYPVFMWITAKTSKKWQAWQGEKNQETDIASGRFAEVVAQVRVVKSFIQERLEYRHFTKRNDTIVAITRKQSAYWHKMDINRRLVLSAIFFAGLTFVFVSTIQGRFTIGDMVLLTTLLTQMRWPVFNMSFIVDNLQKAIAGSRDYFEVMAIEPSVADAGKAKTLQVLRGAVSYRHVSFGYQEGSRVLHDVSFEVQAGQKIAFVGESGEGKTTLTSLLLRLYDVDEGTIAIDDQAINAVSQQSLRRSIAVVFQEPALFSGTIRENIAYGNSDATIEAIERAARAANAYEFIMKCEKGFDTEIGERGLKLSGGQKQRIAIARAILKDAPILVLDEATSSLDSRSEHQVQQALERLMKGRTTLIVAHRLSTIATVDMIVTIKDGTVDEIGTPEELAHTDGIYSQLLALQMGTSESTKKKLAKFDIAS